MSICAAHCSWVCCSKSTSRMTSYSSSVSRIGSVSSHPLGQNASTCGTPQIRRHRGGLGMGAFSPPLLYSVYTDYSTLSRKKQFFQKLLLHHSLVHRPIKQLKKGSFLKCQITTIECYFHYLLRRQWFINTPKIVSLNSSCLRHLCVTCWLAITKAQFFWNSAKKRWRTSSTAQNA